MGRKITEIIVHCSDSNFGDAAEIDHWHRERGFSEIGYNFVILNGFVTYDNYKKKKRIKKKDGLIQEGRHIDKIPAHCKGSNKESIGICLIGKKKFTKNQMISLMILLYDLILSHPIAFKIYGHYEKPSGKRQGKTCPNIDMFLLRLQFIEYCVYRIELSDGVS